MMIYAPGYYRMPNRLRASKSQKEKEKVIVEESFDAKRLSSNGDVGDEKSQGTPDLLEIWAIKFEHTINSVLTVFYHQSSLLTYALLLLSLTLQVCVSS